MGNVDLGYGSHGPGGVIEGTLQIPVSGFPAQSVVRRSGGVKVDMQHGTVEPALAVAGGVSLVADQAGPGTRRLTRLAHSFHAHFHPVTEFIVRTGGSVLNVIVEAFAVCVTGVQESARAFGRITARRSGRLRRPVLPIEKYVAVLALIQRVGVKILIARAVDGAVGGLYFVHTA